MKNNKNGDGLHLTLIQPPALMAKNNYSTITQPPLGLAYLGAVALEAGHQVEIVAAVGEAFAKEIVFTAERFDASRAAAMGLVNQVVPSTQLEAAVTAIAETIAANAPLAVTAMKRTIMVFTVITPTITTTDEGNGDVRLHP